MQEDNQPTQTQVPSAPEAQSPQPSTVPHMATPQSPTPEVPTPTQPQEQVEPKSNKILIIGVVLLLLAIVGATAYLFFQNQNSPTSQPTSYEECENAVGSVIQESYPATCVTQNGDRFIQPLTEDEKKNLLPTTTITNSPTKELTFEQDQMLDWEKYTSNSYSVMYPPDLELKEQEGDIVTLGKWGPTQAVETEFFDGISISFRVLSLPNTTLENYVQSQIDETKDVGLAEIIDGPNPITINNYSGLTYTTQGLGTYKTMVVQSVGGTSFMEITDSTVDPGNLGFSETVDQILNTFEFVK